MALCKRAEVPCRDYILPESVAMSEESGKVGDLPLTTGLK